MAKRKSSMADGKWKIAIGYSLSAAFLVGLSFWAGFQLGRASVPSPRPLPVRPKAISAPRPAAPRLTTFPNGRGKIAIVLDDWGYNLNQVPFLETIRQPLTVAILPGHPYSTEVARRARAQGHEVILHLPMEALDPHASREAGTIVTTMSQQEVLQRLDQSLANVPFARGISNHQGSKATADRSLMQTILQEAKRRRLYFLDSLTGDSVCDQVARNLKLPYARRAVFIDNDKSPSAIRKQLEELAKMVNKRGSAIAIGHDRSSTLQVLQEAVPALKEAGYTLVPASKLAQIQQ